MLRISINLDEDGSRLLPVSPVMPDIPENMGKPVIEVPFVNIKIGMSKKIKILCLLKIKNPI